jgi:hypothetical protein
MAFNDLEIRLYHLKAQRQSGVDNLELEADIDRINRALKVSEEISKPAPVVGLAPSTPKIETRTLDAEDWQKEAKAKLAALQ